MNSHDPRATNAPYWRTHRRNDLLTAVAADIPRVGLDATLAAYGDQITAVFDGFDGLALAAFQRWFTAFTARLDTELADETEARDVCRSLAERNPGLWTIVSAHLDRPEVARAWGRQRAMLLHQLGIDLNAVTDRPVASVPRQRQVPALVSRF
ncbi:hypothetical protein [Fodinicola acaciae]|uniref:hypothetical protein n=1 Tax=Fodinicola acaciae TaxID=2681555 RepID=UPI0013D16AB6|nr:hypothetical protein [Fodinicola acaciae]